MQTLVLAPSSQPFGWLAKPAAQDKLPEGRLASLWVTWRSADNDPSFRWDDVWGRHNE